MQSSSHLPLKVISSIIKKAWLIFRSWQICANSSLGYSSFLGPIIWRFGLTALPPIFPANWSNPQLKFITAKKIKRCMLSSCMKSGLFYGLNISKSAQNLRRLEKRASSGRTRWYRDDYYCWSKKKISSSILKQWKTCSKRQYKITLCSTQLHTHKEITNC